MPARVKSASRSRAVLSNSCTTARTNEIPTVAIFDASDRGERDGNYIPQNAPLSLHEFCRQVCSPRRPAEGLMTTHLVILVHGMVPIPGPMSQDANYDAFWKAATEARPELLRRIDGAPIGVEWGHERPGEQAPVRDDH